MTDINTRYLAMFPLSGNENLHIYKSNTCLCLVVNNTDTFCTLDVSSLLLMAVVTCLRSLSTKSCWTLFSGL